MKNGEKYTFTFDKPGRWGVHDHLYPGFTMGIEVIEKESSSSQNFFSKILDFLIRLFKKNETTKFPPSESFLNRSYLEQQKLIKELSKSNAEDSWKYLKKTFATNGQIRQNPHEFSHIVGNEIYRQRGFNGIAICDPAFAFGCYHGVTEKMLLDLEINAIR